MVFLSGNESYPGVVPFFARQDRLRGIFADFLLLYIKFRPRVRANSKAEKARPASVASGLKILLRPIVRQLNFHVLIPSLFGPADA